MCISLSSTEAEYAALSEVCKTIAWLRRVLNNLGITQDPAVLYEDSSGMIMWVHKLVA